MRIIQSMLSHLVKLLMVLNWGKKIYIKIPGLCAAKSGRHFILTVDNEVRQGLFESCARSDEENERGLNKAAKIVCKDFLASDESFDGDVSEKRQSHSVLNSLIQLMTMILEGGESSRELPAGLQVCANLFQLISSNSVKQKHREGTQKFHDSKNNEPPLPVLIGLMVHARTGLRTGCSTSGKLYFNQLWSCHELNEVYIQPGVHGVPSQWSGLTSWFEKECVHNSCYWQSRPSH